MTNHTNEAQKIFAGIGIKKAKIKLNKQTTTEAKILRLMLDIEQTNAKTTTYTRDWKAQLYEKKHILIEELIDLYNDNILNFGVQDSETSDSAHIICFDFLSYQLSWHFDGHYTNRNIPGYPKKWDGTHNNYLKLEEIYLNLQK